MSELIKIDTSELTSMAASLAAAASSIDSSVEQLRGVTTHDDWNCKERDQINECALQNAKDIAAIQERSNALQLAAKAAAEGFTQEENAILESIDQMDDVLKSFFAGSGGINLLDGWSTNVIQRQHDDSLPVDVATTVSPIVEFDPSSMA